MPISSTEAYVARGMVRCGSCDSSPYNAADSKPMNEAKANISASPSAPENTVDGAKTVVGRPAVPFACSTPRSRTSRMLISAAISTASTRALTSTERYPRTAVTAQPTAATAYHGTPCSPALSSTRAPKYPNAPTSPAASAL